MCDEFTATVRVSAMKRDQAPRDQRVYREVQNPAKDLKPCFPDINIMSINLVLNVLSLNGAFNKIKALEFKIGRH